MKSNTSWKNYFDSGSLNDEDREIKNPEFETLKVVSGMESLELLWEL